jgi:hypothetical protein
MMFQKLINLLNNGKTYSQYELSKEMGVSTETLQGFMEYLSEKGFLVPIEIQKDIDRETNRCSRCSKCTGCTRCSGPNSRLRTSDSRLPTSN